MRISTSVLFVIISSLVPCPAQAVVLYTITDLGTLGGIYSYAYGINDSGQVVGYSNNSRGLFHAFRTAANSPINPATDDLGTLGGTSSYGRVINDRGQVGGYSNTSDGQTPAFRTEANQSINPTTDDLGTLGGKKSYAYGINDSGQVVGFTTTASGVGHAFMFSGSGPMQDLNNLINPNSGWTLSFANGINDRGQIVGNGMIGGNTHAFLLTPVPEPSILALLGMGGFGLIAYGWQRRRS